MARQVDEIKCELCGHPLSAHYHEDGRARECVVMLSDWKDTHGIKVYCLCKHSLAEQVRHEIRVGRKARERARRRM